MHKRYLDCSASELDAISRRDLLDAIRASEGRLIVSETIGSVQPMLMTITNAELAASQGADMLLLNVFDTQHPVINGLPSDTPPGEEIAALKKLTGRVIGVNLEPVEPGYHNPHEEAVWRMVPGRLANAENARRLAEMGAGFIVLTGNPGNGITNRAITHSLGEIRRALGEEIVLIAGKMHAAGMLNEAAENIITRSDIGEFAAAGADIILLPAPGTVPGITTELVRELVSYAHSLSVMTMTAIGTSQEGADTETLRQIALMCKMTGTDLHHLGDAGYIGVALPENIFTYGLAIRGRRHTYARMARSVRR